METIKYSACSHPQSKHNNKTLKWDYCSISQQITVYLFYRLDSIRFGRQKGILDAQPFWQLPHIIVDLFQVVTVISPLYYRWWIMLTVDIPTFDAKCFHKLFWTDLKIMLLLSLLRYIDHLHNLQMLELCHSHRSRQTSGRELKV